jgi:hypothetical protein
MGILCTTSKERNIKGVGQIGYDLIWNLLAMI